MEATGKRQRDAVGAWTLCCFVLHVYRVFVLDRGTHDLQSMTAEEGGASHGQWSNDWKPPGPSGWRAPARWHRNPSTWAQHRQVRATRRDDFFPEHFLGLRQSI